MMIVTSTEYFRIHSQTISMFLFLQKYFTEDVDTGNYLCLVCYCWCWHVCPDSVLQTNWLSERCCSAVHCTVVYSVQCVTGGVSSAGGQYSGHRGHLSTSSCDQWERSEWSHRALLHQHPVTPHHRDYPWCDGRIDPVNATSSIFSRIRIICSMWHKFIGCKMRLIQLEHLFTISSPLFLIQDKQWILEPWDPALCRGSVVAEEQLVSPMSPVLRSHHTLPHVSLLSLILTLLH